LECRSLAIASHDRSFRAKRQTLRTPGQELREIGPAMADHGIARASEGSAQMRPPPREGAVADTYLSCIRPLAGPVTG